MRRIHAVFLGKPLAIEMFEQVGGGQTCPVLGQYRHVFQSKHPIQVAEDRQEPWGTVDVRVFQLVHCNCWKKYGVVMNSLEVVVNSLTVIRFDLKGAGGTLIRLI